MSRPSERGIALVITLIMLAVVTVMAIVFLGVSRRERALVTVTADLADAKLAADAGLARAQGEIIARIGARSNLFAYDQLVSTNFINPAGFQPGGSSFLNVSYTYANLAPLNNDADKRQNLTNLFYDPRPPVFVVTNLGTGASEFRFYLDLNRNGRFDDTDYEPWKKGPILGTNSVGDPQWIGILEHPDQPHSPTNRFVARYAFLVAPVGKMLDVNFMHNSVKNRAPNGFPTEGYLRNQGVGPWEMNLAAFLRDLNTNVWPLLEYRYNPTNVGGNPGLAFEDALNILKYRYANNLATLSSVNQLFGAPVGNMYQLDGLDEYADGPVMTGVRSPADVDNSFLPWPGSDNTNGYFSVEELFDGNKTSAAFTNRLRLPSLSTAGPTSRLIPYNNNTFSRLIAQLGTDSLPANRNKINLQYDNVDATGTIVPQLATNFFPWTPIRFFTNAGSMLLRSQFGNQVPINRIPIWPTNSYTASVHRMLQLTANIGDAVTNRARSFIPQSTNLYAPSVFRPLFSRENTDIFIIGFTEVTNDVDRALSQRWIDLNDPASRNSLVAGTNDVNVFGVPWVIGAKKGFPNFNELYLRSTVQVTRRLQGEKASLTDTRPPRIRQAYEMGISNFFGLEAWNSYTSAFPAQLELRLTNRATVTLTFNNQPIPLLATPTPLALTFALTTNILAGDWAPGQFRQPLSNLVISLPDSQFYFSGKNFKPIQTNAQFEPGVIGFPVPDWKLYVTNRVHFALIADTLDGKRIVDFVNLDNLIGSIDITRALVGTTNLFQDSTNEISFWLTNRAVGFPPGATAGITNQLLASTTDILSDAEWRSLSLNPVSGQTKQKAIDGFRQFLGMPALFSATNPASPGPFVQAPFTPTRKLDLQMSWQANDPLVHYHIEDLTHPFYADTNKIRVMRHADLPEQSDFGKRNGRFSSWGIAPGKEISEDALASNYGVKDPLIRKSDDWDFPTNKFPNIGWLGRVHRGTPWQTVYLKPYVANVDPVRWTKWAGRPESHPTNDWAILELFTTAMNDNAARGLLSVNQTNLAAWSAVLSGVAVLTNSQPANSSPDAVPVYEPFFIEPASPQLLTIVSNINVMRLQQPNQSFRTLGSILAAPALTVASPFLNTADASQAQSGISDAAYERIPQQILSLLKEDEAYVVIYAFGQSLKPAADSIVTAPGVYRGLCTNYQITGEVATKTAIRFVEIRDQQGRLINYNAIVESYDVLPTD
jgi:hypothetical protein